MDLRKLNLDELVGVVNLYPWYAGARKELCARMSGSGMWEADQYADAAMYVGARGKISELMRSSDRMDCSDADVEGMVKMYSPARRVYAGAGDYFSQEEYDEVRSTDDNVFSRYAAKVRQEKPEPVQTSEVEFDMYTETLAQIYLEQGYPEQAKHIYSKLILAYPEKSAYFAALIQKIEELI